MRKDVYFGKKMAESTRTDTPRIFISHAWEDKPLVRRLEIELKAAGAGVWVDHVGIRGGDNLPERISEALEWKRMVIYTSLQYLIILKGGYGQQIKLAPLRRGWSVLAVVVAPVHPLTPVSISVQYEKYYQIIDSMISACKL
ncbi:toll/interleukin-1 receptor domain-containing protein [candidate division KSB1 bacterium]|nr:toll/interleukin-1 receptor domain-containing protein [candidate division KSB1 bacterium]